MTTSPWRCGPPSPRGGSKVAQAVASKSASNQDSAGLCFQRDSKDDVPILQTEGRFWQRGSAPAPIKGVVAGRAVLDFHCYRFSVAHEHLSLTIHIGRRTRSRWNSSCKLSVSTMVPGAGSQDKTQPPWPIPATARRMTCRSLNGRTWRQLARRQQRSGAPSTVLGFPISLHTSRLCCVASDCSSIVTIDVASHAWRRWSAGSQAEGAPTAQGAQEKEASDKKEPAVKTDPAPKRPTSPREQEPKQACGQQRRRHSEGQGRAQGV